MKGMGYEDTIHPEDTTLMLITKWHRRKRIDSALQIPPPNKLAAFATACREHEAI
jgi:hypothetical protein